MENDINLNEYNDMDYPENHDCDCNDCLPVCEYCGGQIRHIQHGYKMDEVAAVCNDCGMVDPR